MLIRCSVPSTAHRKLTEQNQIPSDGITVTTGYLNQENSFGDHYPPVQRL